MDITTIIQFVSTIDIQTWVTSIVGLLTAVIAIATLIPGDEPEATLKKVVDFIAKFSRK